MGNWRDSLDKPNLELKCAYQSLKEPDLQLEALTSLSNYFDKICDRKYAEEWIFNCIFKLEVEQKEYQKFCLASVNAARVTLSRTISGIEKTKEINVTKAFLKDLICDIKPFITEIDNTQDMSWLLINPNNSSAYHYFNILTKLLYGKEYSITDDALFGVGVLIIRHCIELRIKRAIGIDYIGTQKGAPVSFSRILGIFKNLKGLKVKEDLSLDRIIKINEWANHHLHRGLRPYPWQLDWAIAELQKLFYRGFTSVQGSLSSFATFETENIEVLRQEFANALDKEYPGAKIVWQMESEIVDFIKVNNRNG